MSTGVACSLFETKRAAHEAAEASTVRNIAQWLVKMKLGTSVLVTDRVLIGGRTFQVEEVISVSYPTLVQVLCIEVR